MLYYLSSYLEQFAGAFNIFSYNTVRTGGAALTGFLLCLMIGPTMIRWLRSVKVGQYIRKDHVADLHELHKGKAGTPTMGGSLIVVATLITLLLWAKLTNPLLLQAVFILCLLGGVGFLDDYIKLRRKHNKGLSAKGKFLGQILAGLVLGLYMIYNPICVSAGYLNQRDIDDWSSLVAAASDESGGRSLTEADMRAHMRQTRFFETISPIVQEHLRRGVDGIASDAIAKAELVETINRNLANRDLYHPGLWPQESLSAEGQRLLSRELSTLDAREFVRFNRLLLEATFPASINPSEPDLHTKLNVPGLKNIFIALGPFYVLFVILVIVASSNSVNLTDGLDGLAIGASIMSLLAYTGISYIVSRADWSQYLFLAHVPEASELTVFGAALLGTGMGFLWFNSHPAEVFMGDTGSLALGGAIGTMAILTKQELLLILVGGLFVIEGASVIIQVASFKLSGKRVFRMAPLHHHFELMGWSETKVTIRFWILALLFALLSMATLKLR